MGYIIAISILLSHIISKASIQRILLVDGPLFGLLCVVHLLTKRQVFIKTVTFTTMTLATIGLFFMCYFDQENKVIINMFFIFLPPIISFMYQHIKLITYISLLSLASYLINVTMKPAIVFYEGYPLSYNVYIAAFFLAIAIIGVIQSKALNRLAKENEIKQRRIEEEKEQVMELLQKKECVNEAIFQFSSELSQTIQETNRVGHETKLAFNVLEETFNQTVANVNNATKNTTHINEELAEVKDATDAMNAAISQADQAIQCGNDQTRNLASVFHEINEKAEENAQITMELSNNSDEIELIIALLNEISDKINLLSLNAGIEASRAGALGKGFAVIAQEIKNLSLQSVESTKNISTILHNLKGKVATVNDFSMHSKQQMQIGTHYLHETIASFNTILASNTVLKQNGTLLNTKVEKLYQLTNHLVANMTEANGITEENYTTLLELNNLVNYLATSLNQTAVQSSNLVHKAQ